MAFSLRKLSKGLGWLMSARGREVRHEIQFMSDLHLEVGHQYATFDFPARCPYLILAGDIGRLVDYDGYLAFLQRLAGKFLRVFLVLGNHEFYGLDYDTGIRKARELVAAPSLKGNVVLLHKTRYEEDLGLGVTILGCTLWSAVSDDARDIVASKVKDFQKIDGWTVTRHNEAHLTELEWLRAEVLALRTRPDKERRPVLVVTHHAPCVGGTSRPKDAGNAWTSAFATDLLVEGDDSWSPVTAWVFGHTHFTADFKRNGIRVVSSQRGYVLPGTGTTRVKESDSEGFDAEHVLRL